MINDAVDFIHVVLTFEEIEKAYQFLLKSTDFGSKTVPANVKYAFKIRPEHVLPRTGEVKAPSGALTDHHIKVKHDPINHPPHYNQGKIEVIEFIEDKNLTFHLGNVVKYVARAGVKDPAKEIEDLRKAAWYLQRQIELVSALKEARTPVKPNNQEKK